MYLLLNFDKILEFEQNNLSSKIKDLWLFRKSISLFSNLIRKLILFWIFYDKFSGLSVIYSLLKHSNLNQRKSFTRSAIHTKAHSWKFKWYKSNSCSSIFFFQIYEQHLIHTHASTHWIWGITSFGVHITCMIIAKQTYKEFQNIVN